MNQVRSRRAGYLVAAVCLAVCLVMVLPLVMAVLHSVKTTAEASASPPTYLPRQLSLSNYQQLWDYQAGLPQYLFNSFGTAFLAIAFTLLLTVPAGYGLARFPIPAKELLFVFLLLALIIPYQALLTPLFLMFAQLKLTNTHRRTGHRAHRHPAAVQPVHHAQQLRGRARGSSRTRRSRTAPTRSRCWSASSCRRSCPRWSRWRCSRS